MSIQALSRGAAALFLAALISGCSWLGSGSSPDGDEVDARVTTTSLECRWNRSGCIYEGRYESGERAYAEQEARRLNQASIERLQRAAR